MRNKITPAVRIAGVIVLVGALLASLAPAYADDGNGGQTPATAQTDDVVRITTATGERLIGVELALDPASQRRGLMFRRELADDRGMLFIYAPPRPIGMWMKNTYLSLDMLFADEAGRILRIAERTEPFSERVISHDAPVYAVLEVNAGTVERLGIKPGDRLRGPLFRPGD